MLLISIMRMSLVMFNRSSFFSYLFFLNDRATTEIYPLSLHDALPICESLGPVGVPAYREYVRHIHEAGGHLLQVVSDILDLSQIEADRLDLKIEPVDAAALVRRSEEHTSELQSHLNLVCRLLLEKKKT